MDPSRDVGVEAVVAALYQEVPEEPLWVEERLERQSVW